MTVHYNKLYNYFVSQFYENLSLCDGDNTLHCFLFISHNPIASRKFADNPCKFDVINIGKQRSEKMLKISGFKVFLVDWPRVPGFDAQNLPGLLHLGH